MLFSYENRRARKASNFTSGWEQYHARLETEESMTVRHEPTAQGNGLLCEVNTGTLKKTLVSPSLYSSVASFWVFNNPDSYFRPHTFLPLHTKTTEEQGERGYNCFDVGLTNEKKKGSFSEVHGFSPFSMNTGVNYARRSFNVRSLASILTCVF